MQAAYCRIELLGGVRLVLQGRVITRFRTQKTALLLAYLASHKDRETSREFLIEMLWPDQDLDAGRDSLSASLSSLRRQLEPAGAQAGSVLQADRQKVRLNPEAFTTDVAEFEALLQQALSPQKQQRSAQEQGEMLQQAVALYRGEFLSGHYADWTAPLQTRLAERYIEALQALSLALAQKGDLPGGLEAARQALQADPYRESACRLIMRLQAHLGQTASALETYLQLQHRLMQDLQAAPTRVTRALAEQLRSEPEAFRVVSTREALSAEALIGTDARASGSPSCAPPSSGSRPPAAPAASPVTLPLQTTSLFGREEEIAQVTALLQPQTASEAYAPKRRLVTLTGPGGVGKTRLAIEAARQLVSSFPGGIWFVSLADVPHPRMLSFALAHALQLRSAPQAELLEQVVEKVSAAPTLLVLDNFEHLLRDTGEAIAGDFKTADASVLVRLLLERAPSLSLLATSRRALNLGGEQELALSALAVPESAESVEGMSAFGSVVLYIDRAQYVLPDFALTPRNAGAVARLCRKLEGMPLALEMAAAWVKTLSPAQMLDKLEPGLDLLVSRRRDLPPRQRSLRATIEWSYNLLSPEQQQFFAQLSVFRGGLGLEAASAVCELPPAACLDLLAQLQNQSLLLCEERDGEARYRLLETLRQFGAEKLEESHQTLATRQRHANYFVQWSEAASRHLIGIDQPLWLDRLEIEHDNLRQGLAWCQEMPERSEIGLALCGALQKFWRIRGHLTEGRFWSERALKAAGETVRTRARATVLQGAGILAMAQGDYVSTQTNVEHGLALFREIGDVPGTGAALLMLGRVAQSLGHPVLARSRYEEALSVQREAGNSVGLANTFDTLGAMVAEQGDLPAARVYFEQSLAVYNAIEDKHGYANVLNNLGSLAGAQGDYRLAQERYEEALRANREVGNRSWEAVNLNNLGEVADVLGDYAAAEAYQMQGLAIHREIGDLRGSAISLNSLGVLARAQGDDALARTRYQEALTINRKIGNRANEAVTLNNLGGLAQSQGDYVAARDYYRQSISLYRALGDQVGLTDLLGNIASQCAVEVPPKGAGDSARGDSEAVRDALRRAARLWGAAETMREQNGLQVEPRELEEMTRNIASARERMGKTEWDAAWREGCQMTRQQVVDYAIQDLKIKDVFHK